MGLPLNQVISQPKNLITSKMPAEPVNLSPTYLLTTTPFKFFLGAFLSIKTILKSDLQLPTTMGSFLLFLSISYSTGLYQLFFFIINTTFHPYHQLSY